VGTISATTAAEMVIPEWLSRNTTTTRAMSLRKNTRAARSLIRLCTRADGGQPPWPRCPLPP
jgi:hypothetical protein